MLEKAFDIFMMIPLIVIGLVAVTMCMWVLVEAMYDYHQMLDNKAEWFIYIGLAWTLSQLS